jgi:hypothetical protein
LNSYKGNLFNDENIIIEHRKVRYKLEEDLWNCFGYIILRDKQIKTIIKRELEFCYSKPQKRRQDFVDCECDEQTIGYHSNVDKPCAAADTVVKTNHLNDRRNQVIKAPII